MKLQPRWMIAASPLCVSLPASGDWVAPQSADAQGVVQTVRSATVDTRDAVTYSSNFCRVRDTTEEIIIDFGLNDEAPNAPTRPIKIDNRVVMSPYAAKRLFTALEVTLAAHERNFGKIEIDRSSA